jgi:hypothetical protein
MSEAFRERRRSLCWSLIRFHNGGLPYVKDFAVWNAILGRNS